MASAAGTVQSSFIAAVSISQTFRTRALREEIVEKPLATATSQGIAGLPFVLLMRIFIHHNGSKQKHNNTQQETVKNRKKKKNLNWNLINLTSDA